MDEKERFEVSYLGDEEKFLVKVYKGAEKIEEQKFEGCKDAYIYIADMMCALHIAGEDWKLTYTY